MKKRKSREEVSGRNKYGDNKENNVPLSPRILAGSCAPELEERRQGGEMRRVALAI